MKFTIYAIGEKIENFYLDAIKEYQKRLSRYCKINLIFLKDEKALVKKLNDNTYKILLSIHGEKLSSEELALKISTLGLTGISDVTFIIGSDKIAFDESISLSTLDMSRGLEITLIFEQIYRSYRILNNEPYHK